MAYRFLAAGASGLLHSCCVCPTLNETPNQALSYAYLIICVKRPHVARRRACWPTVVCATLLNSSNHILLVGASGGGNKVRASVLLFRNIIPVTSVRERRKVFMLMCIVVFPAPAARTQSVVTRLLGKSIDLVDEQTVKLYEEYANDEGASDADTAVAKEYILRMHDTVREPLVVLLLLLLYACSAIYCLVAQFIDCFAADGMLHSRATSLAC